MAFSVFAQVLLPILVVVASGYLLQRRLELDLQSVNRLSLYLLSPALIFSSLAQSRIEVAETLRIGAFMTLFVISIGAVTWLVALLLQLDTIDRAALMLCVMFMNAGNYGLPAARFAFGQEGFDRAVLFFVVQAILAQTLAIYIAGAGHGDRRGGLVRLLRMPQIYAVLGALAVRFGGLRLDPAGEGILNDVFRGVALVGDAAVPLLLIILGLQLAETGRISEGPKVALATVLRLGLSVPLAVGLSLPVEPGRALDEAGRDALQYAHGRERDHPRDRVQRPSPLREQRRGSLHGGERVHPNADPRSAGRGLIRAALRPSRRSQEPRKIELHQPHVTVTGCHPNGIRPLRANGQSRPHRRCSDRCDPLRGQPCRRRERVRSRRARQ